MVLEPEVAVGITMVDERIDMTHFSSKSHVIEEQLSAAFRSNFPVGVPLY